VKSDFPLSFLHSRFKNLKRWKQTAREKFLELLHYSPPRCDPAAEVVERIDRGDYVREKIYFNTTPSIRVPAYLLVPKGARKKLPAVVALHDHGGFYLWGKEKLVETDDEAPALKNWRTTYYGGNSLASVLVRMGYVVLVIDMFYWGERRMLMPDDPVDGANGPRTFPANASPPSISAPAKTNNWSDALSSPPASHGPASCFGMTSALLITSSRARRWTRNASGV
jgi:hypothetical protein